MRIKRRNTFGDRTPRRPRTKDGSIDVAWDGSVLVVVHFPPVSDRDRRFDRRLVPMATIVCNVQEGPVKFIKRVAEFVMTKMSYPPRAMWLAQYGYEEEAFLQVLETELFRNWKSETTLRQMGMVSLHTYVEILHDVYPTEPVDAGILVTVEYHAHTLVGRPS